GMGEERPLQVNANGAGDIALWIGGHAARNLFEEPQRGIERRGDRGCEKCGGAAGGEESTDGVERLWSSLHHVVPDGAVEVHVKKGRAEQRRSKVTNLGIRVNFTCLPRAERDDSPA